MYMYISKRAGLERLGDEDRAIRVCTRRICFTCLLGGGMFRESLLFLYLCLYPKVLSAIAASRMRRPQATGLTLSVIPLRRGVGCRDSNPK